MSRKDDRVKVRHTTMHFRNWGLTVVTAAAATWHQWFEA